MYYQQNRYGEHEFRARTSASREKPKMRENYFEKLVGMMRKISEQINKEVKEQHGLTDFLTVDGALNMDGYAGDLYSAEKVKEDKDKIFEREYGFVNADNENVRNFYKNTYGADTPEKMIEHWRQTKKKEANGRTEMAITGLLHKILKDKFLVVRSTVHDDYDNGVDNIILNKETGEAICAFDEVHEGGAGDRTNTKTEKIKKIAAKGGAEVRYGIKLENEKLKRAEMRNIPVFYLGLNNDELANLLNNMDFNPNSPVTREENEIFAKLVASLEEQKKILDDSKPPQLVKDKLETFGALIEEFKLRIAGRAGTA